jgi:hypothetical protein
MKKSLLYLILLFLTHLSFSQDFEFHLTLNINNTIRPEVDTISPDFFKSIKKEGFQSIIEPSENNTNDKTLSKKNLQNKKHMDSLVKVLIHKYPKSIILKDSCLILNGTDTTITACIRVETENQSSSTYTIRDYSKGYLIIYHSVSEDKEYILYNPQNRSYSFIADYPYFINDSIIYSTDNLFSEGQFQLLSLKRDNSFFSFISSYWEMEECYRVGKIFYISFKSTKLVPAKWKYIKIDFNAVF